MSDRAVQRVLVLGAGLVAKPLIDDLLDPQRGEPLELEVGTVDVARAETLVGGHDRATVTELDVADTVKLAARVEAADAVMSLLPAPLHPQVARLCLDRGRPLVTTSYVSEAMQALDKEAHKRGVLLLNECGLDPGIDHLMAMDGIGRLRRRGKTVVGYSSCAGGLPAPAANGPRSGTLHKDNPWGYKLSWSPRGVLVAARSPVRYLHEDRVIEAVTPFEPAALQGLPMREMEVPEVGTLEVYANRDSLPYRNLYGLDDADSVFRGTLRYSGWSATCRALLDLSLLSEEPGDLTGETWAELLASRLPNRPEELRPEIAGFLGLAAEHPVLERLAWLGLFDPEPLPAGADTPLDALAARMDERMRYGAGERDLVVLVHRFTVQREEREGKDGPPQVLESRLQVTGEAGDESAMARTVGLPAATACRLILEHRVSLRGVQIPTASELVQPLLAGLADRGISIEHPDARP